jgi:hypothetical protein
MMAENTKNAFQQLLQGRDNDFLSGQQLTHCPNIPHLGLLKQ